MTIKVLTVEDSTLIRLIVNNTIKKMDGIELVGTAENGKIALEKVKALKPDIITMDVVMPVMDGLETLKELRKHSSVPVIMLSAQDDKSTTLEALESGAQDFLTKPESISRNKEEFKEHLEMRIKALVKKDNQKRKAPVKRKKAVEKSTNHSKFEAIVIGASTGGPKMLTNLIQSLPSTLPIPIFIVQHMPEGFTASFAKRLNTISAVQVVEAEANMAIKNGTVYIAPGGKHMVIERGKIALLDTAKINSVKPAIDPMFESATQVYGANVLAVVMTGMGKDGAQGSLQVKKAGGHVIAQDEVSCVVFGMPKCAIEAGAVHEVLSIEEIITEINEQVKG